MKKFDTAAIVGTGLIGGSIALALKKKHLCRRVIGVSLHRKSLAAARKLGAVDTSSVSLEVIKDADLVVLAMPVSAILRLAPKISKIIKGNCLVFDVGSSKNTIVRELSGLFKFFVGAHPLAGSEKRGINFARADLFLNSLCVLTPSRATDKTSLSRVKKLWESLGAKTMIMRPEEHDRALGFVSHLSHITAFSLINAIPAKQLKYATASLKDATRIASSDPGLWADIIIDNRKNVLNSISRLRASLGRIESALKRKKSAELSKIFSRAKKRRDALK